MDQTEKHKKTCKRYNITGHAHSLTFSCFRNRPFMNSDLACNFLAQAINKARQEHNFHLWAYIFMPEHVHLLIYPTEAEYSISDILTSIKQSVSRRVFIHLRRNAPEKMKYFETGQDGIKYKFWQDGGGYDKNITGSEVIFNIADYIHRNPVRRGLVESPLDWHWSSAGEWDKEGTGPISIDRKFFPIV